MSAIDQVIARARQGEVAFAERKQFKLARTRAIEKLRRFALADPYFYILEIIQAAVAGGADHVDIACSGGDVLISWTGGHLREDELAQLFDFLFASKERLDLAHVRSLALGVNALLLFEPEQVVIESGDGSPGGTARMVVQAGADQVDVGRAEGKLAGTYVRATRLNRSKVAAETGRRGDDEGSLEFGTVETRCLTAPVPVVFNSQPLFGWSRQRVPNLYGYRQVRSFDEGDLYGTIGVDPTGGEPSFQLLTHGVWIQSYQHQLLPKHRLGGIICFDRLHKTVDHSGFVRDDRFEEMWVRLRPHAEALVGGKSDEVSRITSVDGLEYSALELREFLREHPRIVIIPPTPSGDEEDRDADEQRRWRGKSIARMLDAEILQVDDSQVSAVRVLGERELLIWRPHLLDERDQRFYSRAELEPPPTPHLLPSAELEPPSLDALIDELLGSGDWDWFLSKLERGRLLDGAAKKGSEEQRRKRQLRVMLGETGSFRATLYSPADPGPAAQGLLVRITTTGRLLAQRLFPSAYPGRVLDVELPSAQPAAMLLSELTTLVAERFAARALPLLHEQDQRALAGLGVGTIEPDSPAARLALQVLARVTVTRLRGARPARARGSGRLTPGLSFSLLRPAGNFDPFALPLLRAVSGRALSLSELALMCDETGGLVYGTIFEIPADLDGLDPERILALDAGTERTLIGLVGEAGYVRVDAREILAEAQGVLVRDLALGLREYPDFPLLLEGRVGLLDELDSTGKDELLTELLTGLTRRLLDTQARPGDDPLELEEHRRQALRHLQWYVCREYVRGGPAAIARQGLLDFPLFLDLDGEVWAIRQVVAALRSLEGLLIHYGHTFGQNELGRLVAAARAGQRSPEGRPSSLAVSCFGYRLLAPLGRVRLAFDFDLDDLEAARNPMTSGTAFLVEDRFTSSWGGGVLGIPATRLSEYRIQLRTREQGVVAALDELAQVYGVVGVLELRGDQGEDAAEELLATVDQRAVGLLERLIARLPELGDDPREHEAGLRALLTYAGEQLTLIADPSELTCAIATPLANRIFGLPLFDTGATTLISGERMLERFRRDFERQLHDGASTFTPLDWSQIVSASAPALIREWLDAHLHPAAVSMPASSSGRRPEPSAIEPAPNEALPWELSRPLPADLLAWNLEHWLARLRPDYLASVLTRIWVVTHELPSAGLLYGADARVDLWAEHPLVARILARPSAEDLAWLLLAIYAHINAASGSVSNNDEARFHLIVGEALAEGRLRLLQSR
ncbi:MAG: hypothetical protein R6X02_30955 [Enhygromyxa sp.]